MQELRVPLLFTLLLLIVIGAGLLRLRAEPSAPVKLSPSPQPVPSTLFGMHMHRLGSPTVWPGVPFGRWRLWDAYVAWPDLEPAKGKWNFDKLDRYVDEAETHNVQVLLVLGMSPSWASARPGEKSAYRPGYAAEPKNLDDWRAYVRTVATRYKGRVRYYEIWNEPNLKQFYTGDVDQLIALTREAHSTLKQVDPGNMVVSPSATSGEAGAKWLERFLRRDGSKYVDVIGFHFYVTPKGPEAMVPLIQDVHAVMSANGAGNKPLWNTETGWTIQSSQKPVSAKDSMGEVLDSDQAAAYVGRSYILTWAAGVQSFFWYAWDNYLMGLVEPDGKTFKTAGTAYAEVQRWLVGSKMVFCASDTNDIWVCTVTRDGGYVGSIVWNPERKGSFKVPGEWHIFHIRDLSGGMRNFSGGQIGIGPSPLLLEKLAQ